MIFPLAYMRLLAILLIVNSHMAPVYPSASMAFGGHLGNSLFYFLSGLGLTLSYRNNPIPALEWAKKRIIKVVLPVVLFIGVVYIGNLDGFIHHLLKYLVWHDRTQLTEFLPVLWVLYAVFLPFNALPARFLRGVAALTAVAACLLLLVRAQSLVEVPVYLPSSDIFFVLNAFLCFMLGMHFARPTIKTKDLSILPLLVALIIASQAMHGLMLQIGGVAIVANFYLNLVSVVAIFLFVERCPLNWAARLMPLISALAFSSLAVYIVHTHIIYFVAIAGPPFPYNAICVYLYSFVFAYGLSVASTRLSSWVLQRVTRAGRGHPVA